MQRPVFYLCCRPAGYLGMYVEEDHIIVDVKPSQESQVAEFLMTFCSHAFDKYGRSIEKTVKYVEQNTQPRFLGKRKRYWVRH